MHDNASIVVQPLQDGCHTMKLTGDINVFVAAELHQASVTLSQQEHDVVVGCEQLQSLDLATLQILIALREALAVQNRAFRVTGLSPEVVKVIDLAGLSLH
jgi:anti-anti-sigma factor